MAGLDDHTQQANWMLGVAPVAWTGVPERVLDGLLAHLEVGGLWADTESADGAQFFFGVDASRGSRSKDLCTRLCWGISVVMVVALHAAENGVTCAPGGSSMRSCSC